MSGCKLTKFVLVVGIALLALILLGGALSVPAQVGMVALPARALSRTKGPALSRAEGPALSRAEGPALSRAEGPAPIPTTPGPINAALPAAPEVGAENVEVVGHIGGVTYAVFVRGNYAYVGEGPALVILDISDPASPVVVGKTAPLPNVVEDIYVSGDYAYIADGENGGLQVVNVSDPAAPVKAGQHLFQRSAWGVAVADGYAYLAGGERGLWRVDVSEPDKPKDPRLYEVTSGAARDVAVAGSYAYVAVDHDRDGGLRVVDISDPDELREVASCNTPRYAHGVAVADGYAYVADWHGGLRVLDVSTPTSPACEVGLYDTPGYAQDVAVADGYAYVADDYEGLQVLDVSNPAHPTKAGGYDTPQYAHGVAVANGYACVADEDSLQVVNVSDPADPTPAGSYDAPGFAIGVAVTGSYAYVGDLNGVEIVDVFTPTNPAGVGSYNRGWYAQDVAVAGDYAYLADGNLVIVGVVSKKAPGLFGFCDTPGGGHGVAVSGDYAYVADGSNGLQVVDVSFPTFPTIAASCDTPGSAEDMAVVGDYAYVADSSDGLRVVDVSDPTNPTEEGFCDTPGYARGVSVADGYAYVADDWKGLQVIDVSNPTHPTAAGGYDTPGYAQGVAVANEYAYVATGDGGLRVVDVSVPISPTGVGFYDTCGYASGVTVEGDYAYVAAQSCGLFILYFTGTGSDPPTEVAISGPTTGIGNVDYTFTAIVSPITAARPITYVWQATGQSSRTHTGGRSDTVSFAWPTTGTKTITVTATNALDTASDTHVITIGPPVPVERVTISGPPTGIVSTTTTCTATVSPSTATQPITYAWQATGQLPDTRVDGPSSTFSSTWYTAGTKILTVTASNAWGSADASHAIAIAACHDAYEPDDTCVQASSILTDGTVQSHTFHDSADEDWVRFTVVSGTTYVVQTTSTGPLADTQLELHDDCAAPPFPAGDLDLGPGARLRWTASQDGTYYLRVTNHNPDDYGCQASYDLSIRAASGIGAAIVVAGRNDGGSLHSNIDFAANRAARVFLDAGLSRANLRYLNSDPHPGGGLTPDAPATSANLQYAIETWAAGKVGPDRPLYLYLVDHGGRDVFLTGGNGDTTSAADLDAWLATLETATECPVNVIVEACRSGSFIDDSVAGLVDDVSKEGRVVIASTSATRNAYALPGQGAYFSDSFFTALNVDADLWTAFRAGQRAVAAHGLWQTPWLDDDGDATPHVYDPDDGREARRRGLARLGYGGIAPYIETVAGPEEIVDGRGTVRARVVDDLGVDFVWALVYPPSFREPATSDEETIELDNLGSFVLRDSDGDGEYEGSYNGFTEVGAYRVVVYAKDGDGNLALPRAVTVRTGWQVYLPLVLR